MEKRNNNFQPSSDTSNIPNLDSNPTQSINPNKRPRLDQVIPFHPCCSVCAIMEMRNNNSQPSSNFASNIIPNLDPNPTQSTNPNKRPRFDQLPFHPYCNIERDDIELHMIIESLLWPLIEPDEISTYQPFMTFSNLESNPTPPYRNPIELPRLYEVDNVVFEQPMTMTSPPPLPYIQTMNCSSLHDDNVSKLCDDLLSENVKSCSNNETDLTGAASLSVELRPPCNEVVDATLGEVNSSDKKRKWSIQEHRLFLVGMEIYGRGEWKKIANNVVITKTYKQVASHAQKYFERKEIGKKRNSIHDNNIVDRELLSHVRARLGLPSLEF